MFFKVDEQIFQKATDYCVGVVSALGIKKAAGLKELTGYIDVSFRDAVVKLRDVSIKSMPAIEKYRTAMSALGINPGKYPVSIEALLRRIQDGKILDRISPIVDLGNAISVKYNVPVGVHDIDSFCGDLEVRYSNNEDLFDDSMHQTESEPVYVTGHSVRTRNWLWRQTEAGRNTSIDAENLLFLVDGFEDNKSTIIKARDELAFMLKAHFGCDVRVGFISAKNSAYKITDLTEVEKKAAADLKIILKGAADHTDEAEIYTRLVTAGTEGRSLRIKLSMDLSSPDVHLGHAVVLRKIRQFQELGHTAVIIFEDFTGTTAGNPLTFDELRQNARAQQEQLFKIIDPAKTEIHFNREWLDKMTFQDVIGLCGKTTAAEILERDDFTSRFGNHTPIGLHEFLYPLIQAYDSAAIKADIEAGGTDQTFNITMGSRIMQMYGMESQLVLLMPLLEGIDGVKKMEKALNNYVGIRESPSVIYEKLMSIPDNLIIRYFNLCTGLPADEIQQLQLKLDAGTNPRDIKMKLAREITSLYCGETAAEAAEESFVSAAQKPKAAPDVPTLEFSVEGDSGYALTDALSQTTGKSKSDIRRLFKQNAISLNGEKVTDPSQISAIKTGDMVQFGKGNFYKVLITG
ncbi:hypothetical protein FACS1894130_11300 [Spirochaetia bacterium]|nr:hypothetical protein FACS1894130_11300 [Spirochaetia bacterium]